MCSLPLRFSFSDGYNVLIWDLRETIGAQSVGFGNVVFIEFMQIGIETLPSYFYS